MSDYDDQSIGMTPFVIDRRVELRICQLVGRLEQYFSLPPTTDEIASTNLTDAEVALVEQELMWAWMHRTVGIRVATRSAFDAVSAANVDIDEADLLDVDAACNSNSQTGGLFAIYSELEQVPYGSGHTLVARNLTLIPQHFFKKVEAKTGIPWPTSVSTSYPLHGDEAE